MRAYYVFPVLIIVLFFITPLFVVTLTHTQPIRPYIILKVIDERVGEVKL